MALRKRERWASSIGLILAMAGNAVGLGNFLRFPVQAAENGGGAFMIPYFISFLLIGLPLMWMEWAMGRLAGKHGHGSTPGAFHVLWKHPVSKYLGVMGILFPLIIVTYATSIESSTVGSSVLSLVGQFPKVPIQAGGDVARVLAPFSHFLAGYIGDLGHWLLRPHVMAVVFFLGTLALNVYVLAKGVSKGIERLAKVALPLLFVMAIVLVIRVFTLGAPVSPDYTPIKGLAFLWEPKWGALLDPSVWLAAAGQIFFTLSLGFGAIITYASYLGPEDDVALNGLATASANEFAEVVLGGSLAIPAAVVFFGVAGAQTIAKGGAFNLGFVSMPAIFANIPGGQLFGALWFGLLFFAGITSSVALSQPIIAFLEDEFGWSRVRAAATLGTFLFLCAPMVIFLKGALDEMDFWAGTFGLVVGAFVESVLFMWIFGGKRAWQELHQGAKIRIPKAFYYISRYITPVLLLAILVGWVATQFVAPLAKAAGEVGLWGALSSWFRGAFLEVAPGVWVARLFMLVVGLWLAYMVKVAWSRKLEEES